MAQEIAMQEGDKVRYIGPDPIVQQDYGQAVLTVIAADSVLEMFACSTPDGRILVGIPRSDLEMVLSPEADGSPLES